MADTGFLFPGTAVGNRAITDSDADWTDFNNIKADDANTALIVLTSPGSTSSGLAGSNFDFSSIPAGATIDGIEIQVGDYIRDSNVQEWVVLRLILADDTDGSANKEADLIEPTTSLQTDEGGGASDLWSETISEGDVKDVDWGFFVGSDLISGPGGPDLDVDFMRMKVYYMPPPVVMAYVYDDGGVQKYNEKVLIAGAAGLPLQTQSVLQAVSRMGNY